MPTLMLRPRTPWPVIVPGVFTSLARSTKLLSAVTTPTRRVGRGASMTLRTPGSCAIAASCERGIDAEITPARQVVSTAMISDPRLVSVALRFVTVVVPSRLTFTITRPAASLMIDFDEATAARDWLWSCWSSAANCRRPSPRFSGTEDRSVIWLKLCACSDDGQE